MSFVLPVPAPIPDVPDATAQQWEQAAPTNPGGPLLHIGGGSVAMNGGGPGETPGVDEWMNPDIFVVPRQGVETGRQLFVGIPGPPPEGHGGYDADLNVGPVVDHSTTRLALFWSNWQATAPDQQMRGDHVVIVRVPPGSTQGYMPTDMAQPNNARSMPAPWDAALTIASAIG